MFLNNRYYDPATGIFLSVDPLVATTGTAYLYANGNPTTLSDPNGLEPGCGATAGKAGKGACAAAHQSADLLGTAAVIRHSGDTSASPINSWFQKCTAIYTSCRESNFDRTEGFGYDDPQGRENSANFRLAMWMLDGFVSAGMATIDESGALAGPGGGLFAPSARLDSDGRLIGAAGEFSADLFAFTIGLSSGFCIFVCLEAGFSGEGPYVRPGVGFAVDSPGVVLSNENPQCGTEQSVAYVSVGVGPAQFSGGSVSPGRSGDWSGYGPEFSGINLPDGGALPRYKIFSAGGGVVHNWTFC